MADNITTQSAVSSVPVGTEIETHDTGDGHRQVVAHGAAGTKTITEPAPTTAAASIVAANTARRAVTIHNAGAVTVYLGKDNTVSTSNGFPLGVGSSMSDDVSTDAWWAITASGTGDLRVIEVA